MIRSLLLFHLLTAAPAPAPPARGPTARAEAAIDRGVRLMKQGSYEEALREFLDAYDLAPGPRTTAQIGLAEQSLGRWVEAEIHLVEALGASGDPWVRKHRPVLEECLATVRKQLGRLEVALPAGGPQTAELRLDGEVVGLLPLLRPLTRRVGSATVEVRAPGHAPFRTTTEIRPGGVTRLVAALQPILPEPPPAPSPSRPGPAPVVTSSAAAAAPLPPSGGVRFWGGAGLVGAGLAAAAAGTYLVAVDGQGACATPPCLHVRDTRRIGLATGGAGLLAVGVGVALMVYRPGGATLAVGPGGVHASLRRHF